MHAILPKVCGYLGIILVSYALKRKGIVNQQAYSIFSSLMLKLTLPCAIIINMNNQQIAFSLLFIILLGLSYNAVSLMIGYWSGKKNQQSLMQMINVSGYNIGCFAMPFVSGFFDATGFIMTSLFDIGNSIMCLGVNYGIASAIKDKHQHFDFQSMFIKVFHSIPVWTYFIMLILSFMSIKLPSFFPPFLETIGNANPFIAMAVIGFSLQITFKKEYLVDIFKIVSLRLFISICLAIFTYLLPIDNSLKRPLIILCFSPIGAAAVVFTELLGLDYEKAACINSIYVIISIIMMCLCISFI